MKISHQYEVTIVCDRPARFLQAGGSSHSVFTVRGDYETVSKALGETGSDVRDQLDRFEAGLNVDDPKATP